MCQAGTDSLLCGDADVCTLNTCDPVAGCGSEPILGCCNDDGDCDDTDACTTDSCDTGTHACSHVAANCQNGTVCDGTETCDPATGDCEPAATPLDCDDGIVCTSDSCDAVTGCSHTAMSNCCESDADCDDGSVCTGTETCNVATGNCQPGTPLGCDDHNPCNGVETCDPSAGCQDAAPLDCDDGAACTTDACDPGLGCVHSSINGCCMTDGDCDDGNVCTGAEHCTSHSCEAGTTLDCGDANSCTDDSCDALTGCQHVDNTAPCDDANPCTTLDMCSGGTCEGGGPAPACDDGNICTTDSCDPVEGCTHLNNTAPCEDGSPCTTKDTCAGGTCVGGPAPGCDDGDICTNDSCSSSVGCTHDANTQPCDDGSSCTTSDVCSGGVCTGNDPLPCDDDNVCTTEICDPVTGCGHVDNTADCDDGDACTVGDVCGGGSCTPGDPVVCPVPDQCHDAGTCDPGTGTCSTPEKPDGTGCDDGNSCTIGDACHGGVCVSVGRTYGNGTVESGCSEQCDDGNTVDGDGCSSTGQLETVGGCPVHPLASCRAPFVQSQGAAQDEGHERRQGPDAVEVDERRRHHDGRVRHAHGHHGLLLCLYDGTTLISSTTIPAAGSCNGKPCWKGNSKGFQYKSKAATPDGVTQMKLKSGDNGKAQIQITAKGSHLEMPPLGAALTSPITVQLSQSSSSVCWQAVYTTPFIKNDGVLFNDKAD